jgi:ribosomal protein S18 acetylase RimI-like enzyme
MNSIVIKRLQTREEAVARWVAINLLGEKKVTTESLVYLLKDERNILIVAQKTKNPVAFLIAYKLSMLSGETLVYLYDILVTESNRRQGIAGKMVSLLKDICNKEGVDKIWVGSSLENYAACALWRSTGATQISEQYVEFIFDLSTKTPKNKFNLGK